MNESQDILRFLNHICIKYGFCLPEPTRMAIARGGPFTGDEMAKVVLEAEGLDADFHFRHFKSVRDEFVVFFNHSPVTSGP